MHDGGDNDNNIYHDDDDGGDDDKSYHDDDDDGGDDDKSYHDDDKGYYYGGDSKETNDRTNYSMKISDCDKFTNLCKL